MSQQPRNGREVTFSDKEILLSTTDLDSHITYANPHFCKIAGFTLGEMLGKPHNLVRHQDMPKAAFADMWQHLRVGHSWMGPVKNRCKNGDFYWVNAFATPIKNSSGKIVEYQSIRTKPAPEVVARAQSEYQKLNNGNSSKATKKAYRFYSAFTAWIKHCRPVWNRVCFHDAIQYCHCADNRCAAC